MAERADGSIVVAVDMDAEGFKAGSAELQQAVKSFVTQSGKLGPTFQKAMSGNMSSIAAFNGKAQLLESTMAGVRKEMLARAENMVSTEESEALASAAEKAEQEQAALQKAISATEDKLEKAKASAQGYYDEVARAQQSTDEMLKGADTGEQVDRVLEMEKLELEQIEAKYASQLGKVKEITKALEGQKKRLAELPGQIEGFRAQAEKAMKPFSETEFYRQLSGELEKAAPQLENYKEQIKEVETAARQTDLVKSLGIEKAGPAIARLQTQLERLQFKGVAPDSSQWKDLQFNILQAKNQLSEYASKAQTLHSAGDIDSEAYQKISGQIAGARAQLEDMTAQIERQRAAHAQVTQELERQKAEQQEQTQQTEKAHAVTKQSASSMGRLSQKAKEAASHVNKTAFAGGKLASHLKSALSHIGRMVSGLSRMAFHSRDTAKGASGLLNAVKRLTPALLAAEGVMGLLRKAVSAYMQENQQMANTLNACWSSIGNMLGPIIERLVNLVALASAYFTKFLQLLGFVGKSTGKAISTAGGAASGAVKKLERQLASFDELNILSDSSSDSGGGGTGTGDLGAELQNVELPDWAKLVAQKLKSGDWARAASTLAGALNDMVASVDWAGLGNKLGYYLNGALTFLAAFLTTFDWLGLGANLADGVNQILTGVDWGNLVTVLAGKFRIILLTAAGFLQNLNWTALANGFSAFAKGFFDGIADAVSRVDWGLIARNISVFLKKTDWASVGASIGNCISKVIRAAGDLVKDLDWAALGKSLADSFMGTWNAIDWKMAAQAVSDGLIGLLDSITAFIVGMDWYKLGKDTAACIANIDWSGISDALFRGIGAALGGLALFLWGLIEDAWNSVAGWWKDVAYEDGQFTIEGLLNGILVALAGIGAWINAHIFKPIWDGICSVFGIASPSTKMMEIGRFLISGLLNGITSAWQGITQFFGNTLSSIGNTISKTWNNVKNWTKSAWANVKSTLSSAVSAMGSAVSSKFSGMASTVRGKVSSIKSTVQSGFENARSSIVSKMQSAMSSLRGQDWRSIGSNICAGIGNGINAGWSWLRNTVGNLASNLLSAAESALGIHSPSVLFKKLIGLNIGYGIGEGIEASEPAILKTVTGVADSIADGFRAQEYAIEPISVDKTSGLPRALEGFSDTITDSFTALLDRLEAIAQRVTFTLPAVAGTVVPYQVSSPGSGRSKTAETIEASNEELGSIIIQVVTQAAAAIVRAIEENGGGDKPLDRAQLLRAVKEDLSKETKMRGRTPLPV